MSRAWWTGRWGLTAPAVRPTILVAEPSEGEKERREELVRNGAQVVPFGFSRAVNDEKERVMGDVLFYGASDDLIEVMGDVPGCDEYNAESASFLVTGPDGGVRVSVRLRDTWEVTIAMVAEDQPMLPVEVKGGGYTCRALVRGASHVARIHEEA